LIKVENQQIIGPVSNSETVLNWFDCQPYSGLLLSGPLLSGLLRFNLLLRAA
jgi:hypothetical protein